MLGGAARNTILALKLLLRVRGIHLVLCVAVKRKGLVGGRHWWEGVVGGWEGGIMGVKEGGRGGSKGKSLGQICS